MSEFGDLIPEFVEESLEHLKNIEEDIVIIEQGGAEKELINRVFRAVHSIKGGSSFLGLKNVRLLTHKMEDIFILVQKGELDFNSEISSNVLNSIDRLKEMLVDSEESDTYDIEDNLRDLKACLSSKPVDQVAEKMKVAIEDTTIKLDKTRFEALRKQGKKVFLIQFELKEQSQGGKNPLEFFNEIKKTGEIIVRNVDMELVLKDDSFTGEGIPLSILYASVLEKDLVAHIFGIEETSVKEVVPDSLIEEELIGDVRQRVHLQSEELTSTHAYFFGGDERSPGAQPAWSKELASPPEAEEEFEDHDIAIKDEFDNGEGDKIENITHLDGGEIAQIEVDEDEKEEDYPDSVVVKDSNEYLTFWVGDERYGINIAHVHDIVKLHEHEITPVPGVEEFTRGVINFRGEIFPVHDFRLRLKFEEKEYDDQTIILVVIIHGKKVGVIVDRVSEVFRLNREQITEAPQIQDIPSIFVVGIGQKDGKFIILLKLNEIFITGEAA